MQMKKNSTAMKLGQQQLTNVLFSIVDIKIKDKLCGDVVLQQSTSRLHIIF